MRRFPLIVTASVLLLAALVLSLSLLKLDRAGGDAAGNANMRSLQPWWIASAGMWGVLTLLWWKLHRGRSTLQWRRADVWLIIIVAVAARLAVLVSHNPTLSDDIHRYTFDGRNLAAGVNPYLVLPADRLEGVEPRWPGEQAAAALINNPQMYTIYLPASQYVFGGAAELIPPVLSSPNDAARVYRIVFIVLDIGIVVMLLVAARRAGRSPWWVALYAWHPLVITEVAGSGHQDVIGIALMIGALLIATSTNGGRARSWIWSVPMTAAMLVKPVAVFVWLIVARQHSRRSLIIAAVVSMLLGAALCAPLLLSHQLQPLQNLAATSSRFAAKWAHFGSVYEPTLAAIDVVDPIGDPQINWRQKERHEAVARGVCAALALAVFVITLLRRLEPWTAARIVLLSLVLFSPTAHPWYLLWALVLMPMSPSPALWVLSLTLPWGYAAFGDTVNWQTPTWVYLAAYSPVYAALAFEIRAVWRSRRRGIRGERRERSTSTTIRT